jgi:Zn-dependent protease with chaperone function
MMKASTEKVLVSLSLAVALLAGCVTARKEPEAPNAAAAALPEGSTAPLRCASAAEGRVLTQQISTHRAGLSPADRALVDGVAARLLPLVNQKGFQWPPRIEIVEATDPNAFATCYDVSGQAQPQPIVVLFSGLLAQIVQGSDARLAAILAHELGHLALHHQSVNLAHESTAYRHRFYTRGSETAADVYGFALAGKAGYAFDEMLGAMKNFYKLFPDPPAGCTACDHPTASERLANLDRNRAKLWRSLSAFDSGVFFAAAASYAEAARCFRDVLVHFPDSWEAHANLGYALLMQYADGLDTTDVKKLNIGHLAMGAFYRRPGSIDKQLQFRPHLREEAIAELNKALKLNPDDPLALANLGIAHLVDPKGADAEQASWLLEESIRKAGTLSKQEIASVAINLAVAYDAAGKKDASRRALRQAIALFGDIRDVDVPALEYNAGMAFAASSNDDDREGGLRLLEGYLEQIAGASAWWETAYGRYVELASSLGKQAKTREQLLAQAPKREILAVVWPDGKHVALADPIDRVQADLGKRAQIPVTEGDAALVRLPYPERGADIIGTDIVLAVSLSGATAPALQVRGAGLGSEAAGALRVGMAAADLKKVLGEERAHARILGVDRAYAIYPQVNLAAAFERERVVEIVLVRSR